MEVRNRARGMYGQAEADQLKTQSAYEGNERDNNYSCSTLSRFRGYTLTSRRTRLFVVPRPKLTFGIPHR